MKQKTRKVKKPASPNYIEHDGSTYEKMSDDSVSVDFDLTEDVYNKLNKLVSSGQFVSIGDAVRYILRREIEERDLQGK